jgi:CRP-like cAMP-binding protein
MATLQRGEVIGEEPLMHLFDSYSVKTMSECQLLRVRYADIKVKFPLLLPEF